MMNIFSLSFALAKALEVVCSAQEGIGEFPPSRLARKAMCDLLSLLLSGLLSVLRVQLCLLVWCLQHVELQGALLLS